jgi:hypothetical protein
MFIFPVDTEMEKFMGSLSAKTDGKGKVHPCTGTEALYRPYGPYGE